MSVLTRSEFDSFLKSTDLSDRTARQQINKTVLSEQLDTRYKIKRWESVGSAPLSCSGIEYLRPCPKVVFGRCGWSVVFESQWFCD